MKQSVGLTTVEFSLIFFAFSVMATFLYIFVRQFLKEQASAADAKMKEQASSSDTKIECMSNRVDGLLSDFVLLKETVKRDGAVMEERVREANDDFNNLRVLVAEQSVTKKEFRDAVKDMRSTIDSLKEDLTEADKATRKQLGGLDKETREQGTILTRIDSTLKALLIK